MMRSNQPDGDDDFCEITDNFGCTAYETYCDTTKKSDGEFRWIRVEKALDPVVQGISTREQVIEQIQAVQREFDPLGRADIYPQDMKPIDDQVVNGRDPTRTISVLQFNTLAEGLSAGPDAKRPFEVESSDKRYEVDKKTDFGGFSSIPFPDKILDFAKRRWRLLQVMLGGPQAKAPYDLIALEEVDRFRGFFAPILQLFGYEGVFAPKTRSPGVRMGWYSDGCALFFKSDVFQIQEEHRFEYCVGSQVCIAGKLKHRKSGKTICVAVTHLKASKNAKNELIRCRQVEELIQCVNQVTVDDDENMPVLVMGDFNADPPGLCAGDRSSVACMLEQSPNSSSFKSAYRVSPPSDDFFTTWKTRGISTTRRIIDYIFYRGKVSLHGRLEIPTELEESKLPGLRYPSDHVAIGAEFELD